MAKTPKRSQGNPSSSTWEALVMPTTGEGVSQGNEVVHVDVIRFHLQLCVEAGRQLHEAARVERGLAGCCGETIEIQMCRGQR